MKKILVALALASLVAFASPALAELEKCLSWRGPCFGGMMSEATGGMAFGVVMGAAGVKQVRRLGNGPYPKMVGGSSTLGSAQTKQTKDLTKKLIYGEGIR